MKLLISAGLLCALAIGCTSNETKKEDAMATSEPVAKMEETTPPTPPAAPMDSATMMKNWQAYMTPGDAHKMMASWDGTWTGETTMWMTPGAPPHTSKGTSVNKTILGGRYQMTTHKGNMMGTPFEGIGMLGYDNAKKKFVSSWVDNMGTGVMMMEGPWDEATKTLTLKGKCADPSRMDGTEMEMREVLRIVDEKHQLMEMYGPGPDGKEYKMMEIKMTKS